MKLSRTLVSFAAAVVLTSSANAQTIVYDHGGVLLQGVIGTQMSTITVAVRFSFATQTTFDGIRFWDGEGYVPNTYSGKGFNWSIYTDNAGLPGAILADGTTMPVRQALGPMPANDADYFQNDLAIGSQTLGEGTYWLGLRDNWNAADFDQRTAPYIQWNFRATGIGSQPGVLQWYGTNTWEPDYLDHAYQLTESVTVTPEPVSIALVATGLLAVFGIARPRARQRD